ncbi:MAG: hypothetical protein ACHQ1D_03255 [Nitrososphaerales archaeon]
MTPIDEIEQLVKEAGGVCFICILNKDYVGKEKPVVISDFGSPVFHFNIEHPAGLSMLLECEKALSDQNIVQLMKNVFWLGESVTKCDLKYLDSTYTNHKHSAPATQRQLIDRVNQVIDKCLKYMEESIVKDKRIHLWASDRMNYYINKTEFGIFIKSQYPQLFDKKLEKEIV